MAEAKITISATDVASDVFARVGDAMNALGENATGLGEKLKRGIEDPMGSLKDVVSSSVTGMGEWGVAAVAAGGVAVAVGTALAELAEKAIAAGEGFKDFAAKTTISVEAASQLDYVAKVAGSSLDQIGTAIFMMQKRMADDSTGAFAGALEKIGLTLADIQRLTPDEQFIKIAEAFKENSTQADRASVAMELFGRAGRELAPLLMKDLGDLNEQAKQLGHTMSTEDAQGLEDLAMGWRGLKENVSWATTGFGVGVVHFFQDLYSGINQVFYLLEPTAEGMKLLGDHISGAIPKVKDIMSTLVMSQSGVALSASDAKAAEKDLEDQLKEIAAAAKKAAEETEKWNALLREFDSVTATAQETIDALGADVVEGTRFYLEHGVAVEKIAKLYGITNEQVRAVSESLKDQKEWLQELSREHEQTVNLAMQHEKAWRDEQAKLLKQGNDDTAKSLIETGKLWTDYYYDLAEGSMTTVDKQKLAVQRWFDDEVSKLKDDDMAWGLHYDALYARVQQKMADITKLNDPFYKANQQLQKDLSTDWDKFLGDVYGGFSKTFSVDIVKALTGDGGFHSVWQDMWKMFKQDVESILSDLLNNVIQGFISGAEQKLGGFLAGLLGGNKSGDSSGDSGGGLLGGLLGFFGHGGGGGNDHGGDENNPGIGGVVSPGDRGAYDSGGYFATGGVVYAAAGWPPARGTDIVPAMLTPRERVLTVADNERFERQGGLAALRNGGGSALEDRIDALHQTIAQQGQQLQLLLSRLPKMMVSAQQLSGA